MGRELVTHAVNTIVIYTKAKGNKQYSVIVKLSCQNPDNLLNKFGMVVGNLSKCFLHAYDFADADPVWTVGGNAKGAPCVFPFLYYGKNYSQCTEINGLKAWCSTTKNYNEDKKWGFCIGEPIFIIHHHTSDK